MPDTSGRRDEKSEMKTALPTILQYESEFDKLAKKLRQQEQSKKNKTRKKSPETIGGRKRGTRKRKKYY